MDRSLAHRSKSGATAVISQVNSPTGIKSPVGIKIAGPDLKVIEKIGGQVEAHDRILRRVQRGNILRKRIRKMFMLVSWVSLAIAFICAIVIAIDEIRHPQKMWIMNLVWPITALYLSVFSLWGYFRIGRGMAKSVMPGMSMDVKTRKTGQKERTRRDPTWRQTAVSDTHCGAGCVIGDVIAELSLFALGWALFGSSLYAEYAGDLLLAWLFGIAFQYFAIKPMLNLSVKQGIIAAVKSDTFSILTFEIGLFGWMALTFSVLFPDPHLRPTEAGYWFMMQIGMILGFFTSYPMNRWLIKSGWKEAMG
jgi:hypothetical protein